MDKQLYDASLQCLLSTRQRLRLYEKTTHEIDAVLSMFRDRQGGVHDEQTDDSSGVPTV